MKKWCQKRTNILPLKPLKNGRKNCSSCTYVYFDSDLQAPRSAPSALPSIAHNQSEGAAASGSGSGT